MLNDMWLRGCKLEKIVSTTRGKYMYINKLKANISTVVGISGLLLMSVTSTAIAAQKSNLLVFDILLNAPFDINECRYEIVSVPTGKKGLLSRDIMIKMYKYSEQKPDTGKCFQREGPGYTVPAMDANLNPKPLPPAGPVVDGDIRIIYSDTSRPTIIGDKWVWVRVSKSKIQAVKFYFPALGINDVRRAIDAKYGPPNKIDNLYLDRYEDGKLEFYLAKWVHPMLSVELTSVDTSMDYDGPRNSVGYVRVDYGRPAAQIDNNPL